QVAVFQVQVRRVEKRIVGEGMAGKFASEQLVRLGSVRHVGDRSRRAEHVHGPGPQVGVLAPGDYESEDPDRLGVLTLFAQRLAVGEMRAAGERVGKLELGERRVQRGESLAIAVSLDQLLGAGDLDLDGNGYASQSLFSLRGERRERVRGPEPNQRLPLG